MRGDTHPFQVQASRGGTCSALALAGIGGRAKASSDARDARTLRPRTLHETRMHAAWLSSAHATPGCCWLNHNDAQSSKNFIEIVRNNPSIKAWCPPATLTESTPVRSASLFCCRRGSLATSTCRTTTRTRSLSPAAATAARASLRRRAERRGGGERAEGEGRGGGQRERAEGESRGGDWRGGLEGGEGETGGRPRGGGGEQTEGRRQRTAE